MYVTQKILPSERVLSGVVHHKLEKLTNILTELKEENIPQKVPTLKCVA